MNRDRVRQIAVVLSVLATIAVNGLANALPLNGLSTGEISDRFSVYFVPAGYVFSIWGLIYLGLAAYAIFQALPSQAENPALRAIGWPFVATCAANIAWLFLWHYEQFPLTLIAMFALLILLIVIYLRLERAWGRQMTAAEKWAVKTPFSIYLGWITVATIANVTSVLDFFGWNGGGIAEEIWLAIMLGAAVVIAALMAVTRRDAAYLLVLVWAFIGIALRHSDVAFVTTASWLAAGIVLLLAGYSFFRRERREVQPARL
ncbi:MAG TPA: hypothetical protein VFF68_12930 [Anaerolineaceae bacterium]|nr:hypothetical protein [Anaerolineaceae bacterium]